MSHAVVEEVLDTLVGLKISKPGAAEKILDASRKRLAVLGTDRVYLYFSEQWEEESADEAYDSTLIVERDETLKSLKMELQEMADKGFDRIFGHAS
jgi:aryl-alcohol dehydrogenase-like predicted oxidoreductase